MTSILRPVALLALSACLGCAQSPPAEASINVGGKTISVKYSSPSVRGRKIFGPGGLLSMDPTYPIWRAGANSATTFHTDAALDLGGLAVPAGNYTLYANVQNPDAWELVVSKETGQWGLEYNNKMDLGRVKMTMSKPAALVERLKYTLAPNKLQLEWENHVASVAMAVK